MDHANSQLEIFRRRLHGSANRIAWRAHDAAAIASHMGLASVEVSNVRAVERFAPPVMPVTKDDTGDGASYIFTISTATVDRMGDTIAVDGWKLGPFMTNPVVLWAHDSGMIPVGKATKVWVQGGRLKAAMKFVSGAISPDAQKVKQLVDGG